MGEHPRKALYTPLPQRDTGSIVDMPRYQALKQQAIHEFVCDACGTIFPLDVTEEPYTDGGVRLLAICTSCKAEYPIVAITPYGVRLRSRIRNLESRGLGNSTACHDALQQFRSQVERLSTDDHAPV